MQTNHCAGSSDVGMLNCVKCGAAPGDHAHLGQWEVGEPLLIDESGQRFRTLQFG